MSTCPTCGISGYGNPASCDHRSAPHDHHPDDPGCIYAGCFERPELADAGIDPDCTDPENPSHRFLDCASLGCTIDVEAKVQRRAAAICRVRAEERTALIERTARLREAARQARIADKEGVIG